MPLPFRAGGGRYSLSAMSRGTSISFESVVERHPPWLYRSSGTFDAVEGLSAVEQSAVNRYIRDGFLVVRKAISEAKVNEALAELQQMSRAEDPLCSNVSFEGALRTLLEQQSIDLRTADPTAALRAVAPEERARLVRKFMGFTKRHPPLRAVSHDPALRAAVERLAGEPTRMFQSMALVKPPGGREKPWHQDHAYFDLPLESRIVGVWIALGTVTAENGAMFMLPGAHRDGPIVHFKRRDWQICDTYLQNKSPVALDMEAGDLVFFDAKIPHGTPTNDTDQQRWALQFHYVPRSVEKVAEEQRLAVFGEEGKNVSC